MTNLKAVKKGLIDLGLYGNLYSMAEMRDGEITVCLERYTGLDATELTSLLKLNLTAITPSLDSKLRLTFN